MESQKNLRCTDLGPRWQSPSRDPNPNSGVDAYAKTAIKSWIFDEFWRYFGLWERDLDGCYIDLFEIVPIIRISRYFADIPCPRSFG